MNQTTASSQSYAQIEANRRAWRIAIGSVAGVLLVSLVALVMALILANSLAVKGVLLGAGIGILFALPTATIAVVTKNWEPTSTLIYTMGTWLVKIIVIMVLLRLLADAEFFDHFWFGVVLLVSVLFAAVMGVLINVRKPLPLQV